MRSSRKYFASDECNGGISGSVLRAASAPKEPSPVATGASPPGSIHLQEIIHKS